jgi:hypothetical protein
VGFKPTIPTSERAKKVHALDRSATLTGRRWDSNIKMDHTHSVYVGLNGIRISVSFGHRNEYLNFKRRSQYVVCLKYFFFNFMGCREWWGWINLVRWPVTGLLYQPLMLDEYGAFGGMKITRWNWRNRRKPACSVTLSTSYLTWAGTEPRSPQWEAGG